MSGVCHWVLCSVWTVTIETERSWKKVAFVKSIAMEPGLDDINENQLGFISLYCKTSGLATWSDTEPASEPNSKFVPCHSLYNIILYVCKPFEFGCLISKKMIGIWLLK